MGFQDARAIPVYAQPLRLYFWLRDAAGNLLATVTNPDTEISLDGGAWTDCANEMVTVGQGQYYIELTFAEMSAYHVGVLPKGDLVKPEPIDIYPINATQGIPADLVSIQGTGLAGGTATLTLQNLTLAGSTGPGLTISTAHNGSPAMQVKSSILAGTAPAALFEAGWEGAGIECKGGVQGGARAHGIIVSAQAGNNHGLLAEGKGSGNGARLESLDTGNGVRILGGASATNNGHALRLEARFGDAYGLYASGFGAHDGIRCLGGATGHGFHALGGATSGSGVKAEATGTGDGMWLVGVGGGNYDLRASSSSLLDPIADAVWDEPLGDHVDAGSAGQAVAAIATYSTVVTVGAIADGVWDELLSGHAISGSAGAVLNAGGGGGGGGGDCLANQVPGTYAVGTAGWVLGRMGSARVDMVSPINLTGDQIQLVRGDDYAAADGRSLEWSTTDAATWPDLTSATIEISFRYGTGLTTIAGSVVTATGANKAVRVELTDTQTLGLIAAEYDWDLQATLTNGHKVTLRRGKAFVLEHFTP